MTAPKFIYYSRYMKKLYAIVIIFVGVLVYAGPLHVSALTVSPTILEIAGDPGTTVTSSINLFNEKDVNQDLYISFENFEPDGETGAPRFIGNESGLATWFSSINSLTLQKEERIDVPFTLTIPSDAEPGGYFAAIFFGNQPPVIDGSVVSIGGRIGVLILLRVNGDIPESGGVLEFSTQDNKQFYTMPPVEFNYRFNNTGGDRVVPLGDIVLTNTVGMKRASIIANPTEGSVLPGSARRFKPVWKTFEIQPEGFFTIAASQWNHFYFGWYTAHLNIGWGSTNQSSTNSYSFFIFPWQLLILIIGGLIVLYVILKITLKSYKASVMKELQKQHEEKKSIEVEEKPRVRRTKKITIKE